MERPFPVSQIANDLLIKKQPQAKDQIQYGTIRSFKKTSERSKVRAQRAASQAIELLRSLRVPSLSTLRRSSVLGRT